MPRLRIPQPAFRDRRQGPVDLGGPAAFQKAKENVSAVATARTKLPCGLLQRIQVSIQAISRKVSAATMVAATRQPVFRLAVAMRKRSGSVMGAA
jgi:hypothetical protein